MTEMKASNENYGKTAMIPSMTKKLKLSGWSFLAWMFQNVSLISRQSLASDSGASPRSVLETGDTAEKENGAEALRFLDENSGQPEKLPDYLFLDINMPLVDGWMFLDDFAKIKSTLSKEFPIYMSSSSIDPKDINRSKEYQEIHDFVIKPVRLVRFTKLLTL